MDRGEEGGLISRCPALQGMGGVVSANVRNGWKADIGQPETGGDNLGFERSAFSWDIKANPPTTGQRLSYDVGTNSDSKPCALNLEKI